MNPWYFLIGVTCLLILLIIGLVVCIILFVIRSVKQQGRRVVTLLVVTHIFLLSALFLYMSSHSTYYRYNDWFVLQNNVYLVEQKYGKFDLGKVKDNEKGRVAYYIYTDNGPIMPDYLDHYYYMEYDEWGVICQVYDGAQPGG